AMQHYKAQADLQKQLVEKSVIVDLARALSGATDFSEFFPVITSAAQRLFEFDLVRLRAFDPGRGEIVADYSLTGGMQTDRATVPIPWSGTAAATMAERTSGFILTPDEMNEPDSGWSSLKIGSEKHGYESVLAVPLQHRGGPVGSLVFLSKTKNNYTDRDIALVEQLGAQISGTVAIAVRHGELRRSIHERAVFSEISRSATRSTSVRDLFEGIGDRLLALIQYDRMEVTSLNEETGSSDLVFVHGVPVEGLVEGTAISHRLRSSISSGWANRFNASFGEVADMPAAIAQQYTRPGFKSWLQIPVHVSERLYGFLFLHSREPGAYDQFAIELLGRVLSHVNPAFEHILDRIKSQRRIRHNMALGEIGAEIFATNSPIEMCDLVADYLGELMASDLLEIALSPGTSEKTSTFRTLTDRMGHINLPERFAPFTDTSPNNEPRPSIRIGDANNHTVDRTVPGDFVTTLVESGIGSAIAVPVVGAGAPPGHILVGCIEPGMFDQNDLRILEVTARYLSSASRRYVGITAENDPAATGTVRTSLQASYGDSDIARLEQLKLVVVDGLPICRIGYTALFESTPLKFVGAVDGITSAVNLANETSASMVMMELHDEDVASIRRLVEDTHVPVLLISDRANKALMSESIVAGASGFVQKGISIGKLVEAVEIVAGGGSIFDPGLLGGFLSALRPHEMNPGENYEAMLGTLSEPELRLLKLIAGGKSNREISALEHFTVGTIKNKVARLYKKIGASSRVDATRIAYRSGLVR
ncbi:MAG: GAF domain-containing protein, partial [Chloroflexi bacterium]|nr:GAF domain-containing protein [Chloroflexota bacterium]